MSKNKIIKKINYFFNQHVSNNNIKQYLYIKKDIMTDLLSNDGIIFLVFGFYKLFTKRDFLQQNSNLNFDFAKRIIIINSINPR